MQHSIKYAKTDIINYALSELVKRENSLRMLLQPTSPHHQEHGEDAVLIISNKNASFAIAEGRKFNEGSNTWLGVRTSLNFKTDIDNYTHQVNNSQSFYFV